MVQKLDAAGFDFFFMAEAIGYPMNDDGEVPEAAIREAVQFPVHDPLVIMAALAAALPRIGFVATASTTAQQPLLNARTFTTLDHLPEGTSRWNTSTSDTQPALLTSLGPTDHHPQQARHQGGHALEHT